MRFGFDIDDTLISLREYAFHIYNKKLNQNVPSHVFQAIQRVEIHDVFGLTDEQGKEMWNSSREEIYFSSCPAYPFAIETLQNLHAQGHEIYYITARDEQFGERTKQWMVEKGFPVDDNRFYYGMKDEEKVEIINRLKLDYYVDDKPSVLDTLHSSNVKAIVKDQPYNQHLTVPRITCWSDFEIIINKHVNTKSEAPF